MLKILIHISLCGLFLGCTPLQQYHFSTSEGGLAQDSLSNEYLLFQEILDQTVNQYKLIGIQLSVKLPDGRIWNGASGTLDLDRHTPMKPSHIIRIGSLTKTYTAIIIFRLIDNGVLILDNTIDTWFPDYRYSNLITLRMLLNHSSGIPEILGMRVMFGSWMKGNKLWTESELLEVILEKKLDFEPGTDNQYSNSNYILLGIIAERATGRLLGSLYNDEIFAPLSLNHTYFLPSDPIPAGLVAGYDRDLIPLPGWHSVKPGNTAWNSCAFSSGGMAANASDVLMFLDAIMNRKIITEESYTLMTQFAKAKKPKDKNLENFGLGLFNFGDLYFGANGHLGLFIGSEAIAIFSTEHDFVLVLLVNVSRVKNSDEIVRRFLDKIIEQS